MYRAATTSLALARVLLLAILGLATTACLAATALTLLAGFGVLPRFTAPLLAGGFCGRALRLRQLAVAIGVELLEDARLAGAAFAAASFQATTSA